MYRLLYQLAYFSLPEQQHVQHDKLASAKNHDEPAEELQAKVTVATASLPQQRTSDRSPK